MRGLIRFFTSRRLKDDQVAIPLGELKAMREVCDIHVRLVGHIRYMRVLVATKDSPDANAAFTYMDKLSRTAIHDTGGAEAFAGEMQHRRGLISAAHAKAKAQDGENVVRGRFITKIPTDPDQVLNAAIGNMKEVVILGYTKDGDSYFASSESDGGDVLWHMKRAERALMNIVDEMERGQSR